MAKRRIPVDIDYEGSNMTPMIDVVFQLLIFFMLVTDMASAQIENLKVPVASKAIKEKYDDPLMLVLNVMPDGTVKSGGKVFWNTKMGDDSKKLEDLFEARRQNKAYQEVAGTDTYVKYPLMIRADRSAHFEHIQRILMIATYHGGVTRVQLGARQETK
jgi:biopolymer transport protein ExbD